MIDANNTIMILNFSKKSFIPALRDLELFGAMSDLRLNNSKTAIISGLELALGVKINYVPKNI